MADKVIEKMKKWPFLHGDDLISTVSRAVDHMLKNDDAVRALTMCYDDGSLSIVVKPTVDVVVAYCDIHIKLRK